MPWTIKEKLTLWFIIIPMAITALIVVIATGLWLPILLVMILIAVSRPTS